MNTAVQMYMHIQKNQKYKTIHTYCLDGESILDFFLCFIDFKISKMIHELCKEKWYIMIHVFV